MARKVKISNELQKRFKRAELKRKTDVRKKREYYLIVCEGEKTEPNYFSGLKADLPKGVLTHYRIDIEGTGRNTMSLIDEALRLKKNFAKKTTRPVDHLWVVFDRDSFTAENFNEAIFRCKNESPEIGCAWSNEAFELWYLLHFHYYNTGMSRAEYKHLLEENLRTFTGEHYSYRKNSKEMYDLLKKHGSLTDAIRNAKSLMKTMGGSENFADQNPCTMV